MKKRFKSVLACAMAVVLCFLCAPPFAASAADQQYEVRKMGQVEIHFRDLYFGSEGFDMFINLNGYVPRTISMKMSGDFTEAEQRASIDSGKTIPERASPIIPNPIMFESATSNGEKTNDIRNGLSGEMYPRNSYASNTTLTSVEYSIMPPGDQAFNGISIVGIGSSVEIVTPSGSESRKTIRKIYIDGKLVVEYTCLTSAKSGIAQVISYKIHDQEFNVSQVPPPDARTVPGQVTAKPSTSKIYVDGKEVSMGSYLIDGNNYVRLRDLAYVLSGTDDQFDVVWQQNKNTIELLLGAKYTTQGGELAALKQAVATPSTTQLTQSRNNVQEYFLPTAYTIGGNNFYKLRDLAHILGFDVSWNSSTGRISITTK